MTPEDSAWWRSIGSPDIQFIPVNEPDWLMASTWSGTVPSGTVNLAAITQAMTRETMGRGGTPVIWSDPTSVTGSTFAVYAELDEWKRTPENYRTVRPWQDRPNAPGGAWYAGQSPAFDIYIKPLLKWRFEFPGDIADATTYATTIRETAIDRHLRFSGGADFIFLSAPVATATGWSRYLYAARLPFGSPRRV